jgi:hypothetical protein
MTLKHADSRPGPGSGQLGRAFSEVDQALCALEQRLTAGEVLQLAGTVNEAIALASRLLIACIAAEGNKPVPDGSADILDVFRVLVRGEPTWTAIRDNCRELVYYRNCIGMERVDALPQAPAAMAVRTARHVYLYARSRCIREGRLED